MKKIKLDELYGGSWEWGDDLGDGKGDILEIKTLREHLEEWIKMDGYICIQKSKQHIQDILDGNITEDELVFFVDYGGYYEEISFNPLEEVMDDIKKKAREQGIKPHKTWYREKVDLEAYKATHPGNIDDMPF